MIALAALALMGATFIAPAGAPAMADDERAEDASVAFSAFRDVCVNADSEGPRISAAAEARGWKRVDGYRSGFVHHFSQDPASPSNGSLRMSVFYRVEPEAFTDELLGAACGLKAIGVDAEAMRAQVQAWNGFAPSFDGQDYIWAYRLEDGRRVPTTVPDDISPAEVRARPFFSVMVVESPDGPDEVIYVLVRLIP